MSAPLGATVTKEGTLFSVWSQHASRIDLCLFDADGRIQISRQAMTRTGDVHSILVKYAGAGTRYGYRASGPYDPDRGLWFDPSKLLVDPYTKELDRPLVFHPRLSAYGDDTSDLVPRSVVTAAARVKKLHDPLFQPGGLVYEVAVRPFSMLHPSVPEAKRGTVAALAHPAVIRHLSRIGVSAVELMPVTAWIDERHLGPLGLTNGWGYNPVGLMALDPRLVPGGIAELKSTVTALRKAGIGVILDLVFNHTGESDRFGPTVSMRGLDNLTYYSHVPDRPGELINDTGCGNTIACHHPVVEQLVLDSLRHFTLATGVDGFRFDLAPIMGRNASGFRRDASLIEAMRKDPVIGSRVLIAEPWDIGPGGYQLGNFPDPFLEWNDRARDDIRRTWRGDRHMVGPLATALAGSSDIFARHGATTTRTVNFIAAHDGFTLMDMVSNANKHNDANGEQNRDGHNDNHSWNNGIEGATDDPTIRASRSRDVMGLLSTLFATRGTIMLTAGDEGGRSQNGNNNAYAQDNALTWLDWARMDEALVAHTAKLSGIRRRFDVFAGQTFFTGQGDVEWLRFDGHPMSAPDWDNPGTDTLAMLLATGDLVTGGKARLAVLVNRSHAAQAFHLPGAPMTVWSDLLNDTTAGSGLIPARSVGFFVTWN